MVEDYCGTNHFDYSKGKKFIFPSIFYVNFKLRITSCRSMDKWRGEGGVGGATLVERGGEGVVCYGGGRRREGVND